MPIAVIFIALVVGASQTDVASVQKRLADYYESITSMRLVYEGQTTRNPDRPQNPLYHKSWDEFRSVEGNPTVLEELWWRYPSQRLDTRKRAANAANSSIETSFIIHEGRSVRYDKNYKSADEWPTTILDPFDYGPVWLLGRRIPTTLNTSYADLLAIPNAARLATVKELEGKGAAYGIVVGPKFPAEQRPTYLKGVRSTLLFHREDDVLPTRVEFVLPLSAEEAERGEPTLDPRRGRISTHMLDDIRPIKLRGGLTLPFPHKLSVVSPVTVSTWTVRQCALNETIPDSVFTDYKRDDPLILSEGKKQVVRKGGSDDQTRIGQQARRLREAEELLALEVTTTPGPQTLFRWSWFTGLGCIGLAVGILMVRRQRRTL